MSYVIRIPIDPCAPQRVGMTATIRLPDLHVRARVVALDDTHAYLVPRSMARAR